MDALIGQIDWSEVGGFVMAVVFVLYIFERAWKMYREVTHKNEEHEEESGPDPGCLLPSGVDMRLLARQVNDLHAMHEVFDDDGVRVWYVRHSFYQMMAQSAEALQKISALLPTLVDNQRRMDTRLEEIQHNIARKD